MDLNATLDRTFGKVDYVVFGALILLSIAIGVFFAFRDKRHNTSLNYFLGDRKLKALPLGISFVVTFQSSILMLGSPAEVYTYGLQYIVQVIGVTISFLLAAAILVPLFHPMNVTSVYEFYYLRYRTNLIRYLGVALGVSYYTLYMGVVMFGTALALQSTAGLPLWVSIVLFSSASVIYTAIGGFKAVIWTDVFQSLVMLSGILSVLITSIISADGVTNIIRLSRDRLTAFDFRADPTIRHTFWCLLLGAVPQFFYTAITQAGVQRIISTPTMSSAKKILYISAPIYCTVWILVLFEGMAVFAYHTEKGCDPLAARKITNPNQIIPFTILEMFHNLPGMPGLFISALAAASLSTISSGLSGLAAVTCVDFLRVWKPQVTDRVATNSSRLFVVFYGILSAGFAFMLSEVKGPLGEIMAGFTGAVAGPETGMFLVSVFFRRSRPIVLFCATGLGLCLSFWMIFGQTFSEEIKREPYLPLGPTDHCFNSDFEETLNSTVTVSYVGTQMVTLSLNQTLTSSPRPRQSSALKGFYSVSYMYFHLIGTIFTILVAILGSLIVEWITNYTPPLEEKYVLPLSALIPGFIRRCVSKKSMKLLTSAEKVECKNDCEK